MKVRWKDEQPEEEDSEDKEDDKKDDYEKEWYDLQEKLSALKG